ncbi:MAG TPA: helix-turn-helix domain-containing protein [Conexibacter sp.]|nr:helix-turn-helix domain-containing protein [Conexibacter sp.]
MHKTIRLDPTTGRDPLRELDDVVRGLLDEGRHITVTVADDDEALSPQQAAERLRLSRQHVRRLIDAGELEAEQMPNSRYWKVSLSSILAFEERRGAARARADRHARELDRLGVPFE